METVDKWLQPRRCAVLTCGYFVDKSDTPVDNFCPLAEEEAERSHPESPFLSEDPFFVSAGAGIGPKTPFFGIPEGFCLSAAEKLSTFSTPVENFLWISNPRAVNLFRKVIHRHSTGYPQFARLSRPSARERKPRTTSPYSIPQARQDLNLLPMKIWKKCENGTKRRKAGGISAFGRVE
ncbi:MAG: hypothetical protein IKS31_07405 [Clostridia bacterium]|nr:hypothetical protein [Clostridia bacterium]